MLRTAAKGAVLYFNKGLYAILLLGTGVYIARQFGSAEFGAYSISLTALNIAAIFGSFGLNYVLIEKYPTFSVSQRRVRSEAVTGTFLSALAAGLVVTGILFFLLEILIPRISPVALAAAPWGLFLVLSGLLIATQRQILNSFLEGVVRPLAFLAIVFYGSNFTNIGFIWLLVSGLTLSYLMPLIVGGFVLSDQFARPTMRSLQIVSRSNSRNALIYCMLALYITLTSQIDRFFLLYFTDPSTVGVYSSAQNVLNLVNYGVTALMALLLPIISSGLAGRIPIEVLVKRSKLFARVATAAAGLLVAVVFFWGGPILSIFGEEFTRAKPVLLILAIGLFLSLCFGFSMSVISMGPHRMDLVLIMIVSVLITCALCYFLTRMFGMEGAALSNASGLVMARLLCHISLYRRQRLNLSVF